MTKRYLRGLVRVLGAILAGVVLALALFALAGWIGSSIPRNGEWRETDEGIEILVGSNGVHTELVLPLVTPIKDWRPEFPAADLPVPGASYTFGTVKAAQARGDFQVLVDRDRRALRVHMGADVVAGLETLDAMFAAALTVR